MHELAIAQGILEIMAISCKTGEGLDNWFRWIEERTSKKGS